MLTIEKLKEYGADTDDGLKRCLNNADFYIRMVQSIIPDTRIDDLAKAIAANDLDSAFDIAHALKGIYGNIAITPIYKPVCEITELLRNRTNTDYSALLEEISVQKQKLVSLSE